MSVITYEELNGKLQKVTVVDVRKREEVEEQGQLPGSHVLPIQELEEALGLSKEAFKVKYGFPELDPKDSNLVITCRSGRRVGLANELLAKKGFTSHRLYNGSFLDWTAKGGSVIKPGKPFQPKQ